MPTRTRKSRHTLPSSQSTSSSPSSTPKKSVRTKKDLEGNTSRTIHSFFNATTQRLQQRSETERSPITDNSNLIDDVIEDTPAEQPLTKKRAYQFVEKKSKQNPRHQVSTHANKFLRRADGARAPVSNSSLDEGTGQTKVDSRPWSEKYAPQNLEDLAVHKKKVSDVRGSLEAVLAGTTRQRLLILKGATGSGKTITVSLLAQALGLGIVEWRNPASVDFNSSDYSSSSARFDDFINRGVAYNALEFEGQPNPSTQEQNHTTGVEQGSHNQLLLVEEYPAFGSQALNSIEAFRASLLRYVATGYPDQANMSTTNPLVMIISESLISNAATPSENFTAHRLFGPDILNHPNVRVIEFNPVAPTFIAKALNTIIQKHSQRSGSILTANSEIVRKFAEMGDIRNAVSTLEYYCLEEGAAGMTKHAGSSAKKPDSSKKSHGQPVDIESSLSRISLRESTLGLFHAVGKVVYNKRILPTDQSSATESHLPSHFSSHRRTHPSEVNIDELASSTGTDHSTFLSAVHENYLMSCQSVSADNEAALNITANVLDNLSDSDILLNHESSSELYHRAHEKQTQADLAFNVGVRGTLFELPHPVRRVPFTSVRGRGGKADAHRMFYPVSLKLWKVKEENLGTIEWLTRKAMAGTLITYSSPFGHPESLKPAAPGVSQPRRMGSISSDDGGQKTPYKAKTDEIVAQSIGPTSIGSGNSARHEMILERLPYIAQIINGKASLTPMDNALNQIQAMTKFTGIEALLGAGEEDDAGQGSEKSLRSAFSFSSGSRGGSARNISSFPLNKNDMESKTLDVEKLVLSDDDIEDE